MDPLAVFTTNLKAARGAADMTQEQLANEAGIGQAHLSRIENGRHDPSIRMVAKIASALKVSVADLMKGI